MPCSAPVERWVARARVALGTLVEIALLSEEATEARFAAGFAAIDHVHRTMSAHDSESDVARIAREGHRRPVRVDPATIAVLRLALELWRETHGAFDVTVAPVLARRGGMGALRLLPDYRVCTTLPITLDLGGIAKGYAVDRSVDALRGAGASSGRVNAGGDLRVFGANHWMPVRVRHPAAPNLALPLFDVRDFAVATSADYFAAAPALIDPRSPRARPFGCSLTVAAPACALADALTKIVALQHARAPALLARHKAHAFRIAGDRDAPRCETTCRQSTARLRLPTALTA